ncbi:MAG: 2-hydroxyacyl-CoA dehydratase family protein [Actinomycetota bacterium]|nr:2-hydroxyacyl-CoA dehydratase family protein [Actinomycetota bacterium]
MGIVSIKEKIIDSIQNNLDIKSVRKILKLISNPIVFFLYGLSFKSVSDKYLNKYSLSYMREVYCGNHPIAYGSLFIPYEILNSLNLKLILPEVMGGFTAGLGVTDKTLSNAANNWYSADLCTFHRSASGAANMSLFPKPDFIICSNLACDAACKSFEDMAKKFEIEDRFYLIDIPYENDEISLKYLAVQLENIYFDISDKLKIKPDINNLKKALINSNKLRSHLLEVNKIREELFDYPQYYNGLSYILPLFGLSGTSKAAELYRIMEKELKAKLRKQIQPGKMKKILWMHLKPYYRNEIFNILEENGCRVVCEEITDVFWEEMDPEKPFISLASKMISNPLRGNGQNRINTILSMAEKYKVDGAILFSHWGCRQSNGLARILKDRLAEIKIPLLILDGDCVDKNNCPSGQIKTRIEGFTEIINSL